MSTDVFYVLPSYQVVLELKDDAFFISSMRAT
jgi:hypothetical protein